MAWKIVVCIYIKSFASPSLKQCRIQNLEWNYALQKMLSGYFKTYLLSPAQKNIQMKKPFDFKRTKENLRELCCLKCRQLLCDMVFFPPINIYCRWKCQNTWRYNNITHFNFAIRCKYISVRDLH